MIQVYISEDAIKQALERVYIPPEILRLKSCPFCGGKAERRKTSHSHYIQCIECLAQSRHFRKNGRIESVAAWNNRCV